MDPNLRAKFNADFTLEKYAALVRCADETEKWPADFRISETPIFLTREFTDEATRAADEIVAATPLGKMPWVQRVLEAPETLDEDENGETDDAEGGESSGRPPL